MTPQDTNKLPRGQHKHCSGLSSNVGIDAVHVNGAREMVKLHTRGRLPQHLQQNSGILNEDPKQMPERELTSGEHFHQDNYISVPASDKHKNHNPQCHHCGQVIIPSPVSSFPVQDEPSIRIGDWIVFTIKKPILTTAEIDNLNDHKFDFALPEMIFGNNAVMLKNTKNDAEIKFNAIDALETLDSESDLKVSCHEEWLASRRLPQHHNSSLVSSEKTLKANSNKNLEKFTVSVLPKSYDWTYSTNYKGTCKNIIFALTDKSIPVEKLLKPDPILFYDALVLYEDELGDNGISILSTKIRVMPTCLFLLCRFFLRIDDVIFRTRDTRIFFDMETKDVLREYRIQESPYKDAYVKASKISNDPKKLLRDPDWVSQNIDISSVYVEEAQ